MESVLQNVIRQRAEMATAKNSVRTKAYTLLSNLVWLAMAGGTVFLLIMLAHNKEMIGKILSLLS